MNRMQTFNAELKTQLNHSIVKKKEYLTKIVDTNQETSNDQTYLFDCGGFFHQEKIINQS